MKNYKVSNFGGRTKESDDRFSTKKEAVDFMKNMYSFMVQMEVETFSLVKIEEEDGYVYDTPIKTKYTIHNY